MPTKIPRGQSPPKRRWVSPEERAWLDQIIRQLAYDEYMQAKRELWLAERPSAQHDERRKPHDE